MIIHTEYWGWGGGEDRVAHKSVASSADWLRPPGPPESNNSPLLLGGLQGSYILNLHSPFGWGEGRRVVYPAMQDLHPAYKLGIHTRYRRR